MIKEIELDCPPGNVRPGDLIAGVIEGTGLSVKDSTSRCFGNWTWVYTDDVTDEQWELIQKLIESKITALYKSGAIRYGSW